VAHLVDDLAAARRRSPAGAQPALDEALGLCVNATAAVHEAAIETMLHGFCELDEEGRVTYANAALLEMIPGCEGKPLSCFLDVDGDWLRDQLEPEASRKAYKLEVHSPYYRGPVLVELGPLADGVRGGFAVITDLAPEQDERRRVDDMAEFPILRLDAATRITYANGAACRLLQTEPEDLIGLLPTALVANAEELERVGSQTEQRRKGVGSEYDVLLRPPEAHAAMHIRVRSMPEMDPDGQLTGIFVTLAPIDAEVAAERISHAVTTAEDPNALFDSVVEHLRGALPFGYATLSIYAQGGRYSRLLRSVPDMETNQRWVKMPESVMDQIAEDWTVGEDISAFLQADPDRAKLAENLGVKELVSKGMKSWASITVPSCDCHAVFSVMHAEKGFYDQNSVGVLEKTGIRHAMRRVLQLGFERENSFQLSLIKKMAQARGDLELAELVVRGLADFYGWQNVSMFKVNALHRQFELLTQAEAESEGYRLPEGYRQPIDSGFLGKALRQGTIEVVSDAEEKKIARTYVRVSALTRSEMCVPIRVEDRVAWILNIEDRRPHAFMEPDRAAVERLMRELEPSLERALSAALLEQVLEDAPDGVVITDFDSRILKCNRAATAMLGGAAEGRNLADYFEPHSKGAEVAMRARSERTVPIEACVIGAGGTRLDVLMRSRVPRDEYERRVVVLQDRQKIDWQAETRRLATVTSEARVPLSLVSTFVRHIATMTEDSSPDVARLAEHAIRQLERVELTYDRLLESESRGRRSKVDLKALLLEAVDALPPLQRGLVRIKAAPGRPPLLRCDRARLASALESMLAYLLRIGDEEAPILARLQAADSALELRLFKPRQAGRCEDAANCAAAAANEARARAALDEPRLFQLAGLNGGRFSRRRGAHGETLRLVLAAKGNSDV
jgi:PAS domain-containing protein